jgi:DNA-binding CsgD family transcriptional regulator
MKGTAFFQEVLDKQDVLYGAGTLLMRQSGVHGMIVLNRSECAGPFSGLHFQILRALAPHLNRLLRITLEMNTIACERAMFVSALNDLAIGIIFADWRGKLLHLNRAAESMLAANDGLGIKGGRVAAAHDDENRALAELIAGATGHGRCGRYRRGGNCRITRSGSEALPWLLLVAPCGEIAAHGFTPLSSACMILIFDPAARSATTGEHLRQLFGLTGQESKISLLTAEGHGIAHVADEMGLSALTVRNHLQRVFEKTGTGRQAELARLVGALSVEGAGRSNSLGARQPLAQTSAI